MQNLIDSLMASRDLLNLQIMLAEICDGDMKLYDTLCKHRDDLNSVIASITITHINN